MALIALLVELACTPLQAAQAQDRPVSAVPAPHAPIAEEAWSATENGASADFLVVLNTQAVVPTAVFADRRGS